MLHHHARSQHTLILYPTQRFRLMLHTAAPLLAELLAEFLAENLIKNNNIAVAQARPATGALGFTIVGPHAFLLTIS